VDLHLHRVHFLVYNNGELHHGCIYVKRAICVSYMHTESDKQLATMADIRKGTMPEHLTADNTGRYA